MSDATHPAGPALFLFFPALTMCVGWGLRGFIGGGPLGAMIPGALAAMALCLLLKAHRSQSGLIAALGALGVGFGGEMTYGETIGLISRPESFWWGFAGLAIKGSVWGLLGGALVGTSWSLDRHARRDLQVAAALLVLGTAGGWALVNRPRLIYFSTSRAEGWAGLLAGALAWLIYLAIRSGSRTPALFALLGALGGGIGFAGGGSLLAYGRSLGSTPPIDFWKLMEFHFGFWLGAAFGLAALSLRTPSVEAVREEPQPWPIAAELPATLLIILGMLGAEAFLPLRFSYAAAAALLLCLLLLRPSLAWQAAVSLTSAAFTLDLVEYLCERRQIAAPLLPWLAALAAGAGVGWLMLRRQRQPEDVTAWAYLLLLWSAVGTSWLKVLVDFRWSGSALLVQLCFTAGALVLHWIVRARFSIRSTSGAMPLPSR